ncbi:MAG: alpha/beta hydrolase [Ignavibacteriales bacterium]|nr:alpha/beta hydrolase [Ignavibacteriales bacterium]
MNETSSALQTSIETLPGIRCRCITTSRLRTRVLFSGPEDGEPVLFLHGNLSSATWWEESMLRLPPSFRGIAPDQRGFGDADPSQKIDARLGLADLAEDVTALLDSLEIGAVHVVGNSLGGSVVWRLLAEAPGRLLSVTLVAPGSPFGFGGTKDEAGTPCQPDFAGSGSGIVNRKFVQLIACGDRSTASAFSPRNLLRALVFRPPFVPAREEAYLSALMEIHLGEHDYPGDSVESPNWPNSGPGIYGASNALSPKYALSPGKMISTNPKPSILWIRGADDLAVADESASDLGRLGQLGLIPRWPGIDIFPAQPMLRQTRNVLDTYAAEGGAYREIVIPKTGHVPFIEAPEEFDKSFHHFLFQRNLQV